MTDLENCRENAERERVICREMHDLAQQQAALIKVLVSRLGHIRDHQGSLIKRMPHSITTWVIADKALQSAKEAGYL